MEAPAQEPDLDQGRRARFERSRGGQTILTYALLVIVVTLIVQNLPASVVRRDLGTLDRNASRLGYDQDWSVFAPDPRAENLRFYATLSYPDATTEQWHVPKGSPWWDAYGDYRWQKYQERVRLDDFKGLDEPLARWLVATHTRSGKHPVKVVFTRQSRPLVPIDARDNPQPTPWTSQDFYTYTPSKP